jgi:hypothetical protein
MRLKEAMPELVTVQEARGFFSSTGKVTGVSVDLGEHQYTLQIHNGRLKATIAMVVRGIALNTKDVDPAEWFVRLSDETKKISEHAQALPIARRLHGELNARRDTAWASSIFSSHRAPRRWPRVPRASGAKPSSCASSTPATCRPACRPGSMARAPAQSRGPRP